MPRRVTSRIHDYFIYDEKRSICQLLNKEGFVCNVAIKGKHAGNLEKHVKTWHADEWKSYWSDKSSSLSQSSAETSTSCTPHFVTVDLPFMESEVLQFECSTEVKKRKLSFIHANEPSTNQISTQFSNIEEALIELTTVNGIPVSIVEESGFKKLLALCKFTEPTPNNPAISRNRLQKLIKIRADSIRSSIADIVKNKLICLKIDCAIVDGKHLFGISVHVREAKQLQVLNLAVFDLPADHGQDMLKEQIMNILLDFGIQMQHIYYLMVTNCSPAIKKSGNTEDVENSAKPVPSAECKSEDVEYEGYDSDFDLFEVEETEFDSEEGESHEIECDEEVKNDEATEKLVEEIIACWSQEEYLIISRSLTYALQMAVLDTLNEEDHIRVLLKKIRTIVKKLRSPTYAHQLKALRCKKKPILDSKNRLFSSYDMLQRLMELKPYLDQLSASSNEISITLAEWNVIMDIVDSLKPLKLTGIRLFSKHITLSEFYKIWITCFLRTKKIGTSFSSNFCKNLNKRKALLFENIAFKSCLFLDPRFKNTLNPSDHEEVFAHLVQLNNRLNNLQPARSDHNEDSFNLTRSIKVEQTGDDEDDELYNYIQSMVKTPTKPHKDETADITTALQAFKNSEPLLEIQNVPAFWQEKKYLYSEVYELSQIILSIPPTNAFLDTFVSQIKFFSGDTDSRSLKDILLIRSNFDFFRNRRT